MLTPCSVIRELLAELKDPYTRFIQPADFSSMLKYDVSGVGLNLGTIEELRNKTVGELQKAPHDVLLKCVEQAVLACGASHVLPPFLARARARAQCRMQQ